MNQQRIIFTDLDATLLDSENYSFLPALPFLKKLKKLQIPIVLCTSKTSSETFYYLTKFGLNESFVVENGGAVYIPLFYEKYFDPNQLKRKQNYLVKPFGKRINDIIYFIDEFKKKHSINIVSFLDLSIHQIAKLTGLPLGLAKNAAKREYILPFFIKPFQPKASKLLKIEAKKAGYRIQKGGKFYYISGNFTKGVAVDFLLCLYKKVFNHIISIGLGDSENDMEMLEIIDIPILIRQKDGGICQPIVEKIKNIHISNHPGPVGWVEMLQSILLL